MDLRSWTLEIARPAAAFIWSTGLALAAVTSLADATSQSAGAAPADSFAAGDSVVIEGRVVDETGPVEGATVRVQGTANAARANAEGEFTLTVPASAEAATISAWKSGYYCSLLRDAVRFAKWSGSAATGEALTPASAPEASAPITIRLTPYPTTDNPAYDWIPPYGDRSCSSCHPDVTALWAQGAHSRSASNPRFLSMYNGTDVKGNRSPPTRRTNIKDYGPVPLPPDPTQANYGPGFKLDFPDIAGNCAACHVPGAAVVAPYGTDPNSAAGADAYGIHCDYCHKIASVMLDPATGLPLPNRPGVLSTDLRRPFLDRPGTPQVFFGTLDDPNAETGDACLPLLSQSEFCAPCHQASFWNVPIYESFREWLESPYSDPATGRTCQECHMPSPSVLEGRALTNLAPGDGGIERDPAAIHAHIDRAASEPAFLREAVSLRLTARLSARGAEEVVIVQAVVTNEGAGHHYPTDSPLRHLLLVVRAFDDEGTALEQVGGPRLPRWAGEGDPERGRLAGLPGRAYAKVLEESWTGVSPTAAYWNNIRLVSDNRLAAMASDTTLYKFRRSQHGKMRVSARLLYRRAFIDLMERKGWDVPDIVLATDSVQVAG